MAGQPVTYALENPETFSVVDGKISLQHSGSAYISPGMVTLSGLEGRRALVKTGDDFKVNAGMSYYLSSWIKTIGESRGRTQARAVIKWYDAAHNETGTFFTPWAISDYDWLEYGDAGNAPERTVAGQTFIEVMFSSLGPPPPGFTPVTFVFNHLTVTQTPNIRIETGRRSNLISAGEPLNLNISVEAIPQGFENAVLEGKIIDYWRKSVSVFSLPLASSGIRKTLEFPNLKRGYYSIEWSLKKSGVTVRTGILSAAIIPSLHSRLPGRDIPFAIDAGLSAPFDRKPEITIREGSYMAQMAGVHTLRERPGPKERMLKNAKIQQDAGIDPYHILSQSFRNCLRTTGESDPSTGSLHLMEVYEGAKKLSAEFGDLLRFWEVWNEPDIFFFPGRAEEFAAISKAAYLGTHAGNPNARVLLGSLAHVAGPWYEDVMKNGYRDYFDIFNMHYYIKPIGVVNRIRSNKAFLEKFDLLHKPIWLTEMGYYCFKNQDGTWWRSEQEQAIHAVRAACHSVSQGVNKFFIFYFQEFLENAWAMWGITRSNWTPKPAYAAYANLTYILGKGKYLGYFDLGLPNSYGYVFESGNGPIMAAWAQEDVEISLPGHDLSAVDIMGIPTSPKKLSRYPIYISGIDLNSLRFHKTDWGTPDDSRPDLDKLSAVLSVRGIKKNDAPLYPEFRNRVRKEPLLLDAAEAITLELKVCNFSEDSKTIAVQWNLPAEWKFLKKPIDKVSAGPWSEQNLRVEVQPQNTVSGEFYEVEVNGSATGRKITPAYMRVQIK